MIIPINFTNMMHIWIAFRCLSGAHWYAVCHLLGVLCTKETQKKPSSRLVCKDYTWAHQRLMCVQGSRGFVTLCKLAERCVEWRRDVRNMMRSILWWSDQKWSNPMEIDEMWLEADLINTSIWLPMLCSFTSFLQWSSIWLSLEHFINGWRNDLLYSWGIFHVIWKSYGMVEFGDQSSSNNLFAKAKVPHCACTESHSPFPPWLSRNIQNVPLCSFLFYCLSWPVCDLDGSPIVYHCSNRIDALRSFSSSQSIYNSWSNKWDLCEYFGLSDDDEDEDSLDGLKDPMTLIPETMR